MASRGAAMKTKAIFGAILLVLALGFHFLDAKFWGVLVMGGSVVIFFFLPWLDKSPVKSIRYRPTFHKYIYGVFVVCFVILGYLGIQPPSPIAEKIAQLSTILYFGFFLAMPYWSKLGEFKPVPDTRNFCSLRYLTMNKNTLPRTSRLIANVALTLGIASVSLSAIANEDTFPLDRAPNRLNNMASLQNGAKLFTNYCLNCHSAQSVRYNRLRDIGLTDEQIRENTSFLC
jgi:hypothetical protein